MSPEFSAVVVGATGLVGKALLEELLRTGAYHEITVITRKKLNIKASNLYNVLLPDFDHLKDRSELFDVNHVFCCIGMEWRRKSDKIQLRKTNLDYPLMIAKLSKGKPAFRSFHVVTSVGATTDPILYYNTLKGQVEYGLRKMNIPALKIYRPSLIIGKRQNRGLYDEFGKYMCYLLSFFMIGSNTRRWSIHARDIAGAMVKTAIRDKVGTEVFHPNEMVRISRKGYPPVVNESTINTVVN